MGSYAYKYCMCFTRKFQSPDAQPLPDVRAAHLSYCCGFSSNGHGLHRFLSQVQGESPTDVDCLLAALVPTSAAHGIARLVTRSPAPALPMLDDFFEFLFSPDLKPPINNQVHQDMSAPFSHYFVFTGHNSYLTGNQLNSDSSDVPIIKALQRGVRVIELDMWPNSSKNNVDILHGGLVLEGWWCFDRMVRFYNIEPKVEHFGCMMDLLGRARLLKDSEKLIENLQAKVSPALWGTLISGSRTQDSYKLGEFVGNKLM